MGSVASRLILGAAANGNEDAETLSHSMAAATLKHKVPDHPHCGRLTRSECARVLHLLASTGNSTDTPGKFLEMVGRDLVTFATFEEWEKHPDNLQLCRDGGGVCIEYAFECHRNRAILDNG